MVTSYVHDRPVRGLATNLSDSGMSLSAISRLAPPPGLVVGLELEVPGLGESIWTGAQVCYRKDDHLASGLGMGFAAPGRRHARGPRGAGPKPAQAETERSPKARAFRPGRPRFRTSGARDRRKMMSRDRAKPESSGLPARKAEGSDQRR